MQQWQCWPKEKSWRRLKHSLFILAASRMSILRKQRIIQCCDAWILEAPVFPYTIWQWQLFGQTKKSSWLVVTAVHGSSSVTPAWVSPLSLRWHGRMLYLRLEDGHSNMGNILLGRVILSVVNREKETLLCPFSCMRTGTLTVVFTGWVCLSVNKLLFIARF